MEKEKSNNSLKIIFGIVIIALLAVIGVLAYKLLHQPEPEAPAQVAEQAEQPAESDQSAIGYDSGAVAIDDHSLSDAYNDLLEKAKEGTMALSMKMVASSSDGENFTCELGNDPKNRYDMYMELYLDDTQELIYKSGLIPLGMEINQFKTSRKLAPGSYEATLVYVQVEEDKATVHSRLNVGLTLNISAE